MEHERSVQLPAIRRIKSDQVSEEDKEFRPVPRHTRRPSTWVRGLHESEAQNNPLARGRAVWNTTTPEVLTRQQLIKGQELAMKRHSLLHGLEWFHLWGPDESAQSFERCFGSWLVNLSPLNVPLPPGIAGLVKPSFPKYVFEGCYLNLVYQIMGILAAPPKATLARNKALLRVY